MIVLFYGVGLATCVVSSAARRLGTTETLQSPGNFDPFNLPALSHLPIDHAPRAFVY